MKIKFFLLSVIFIIIRIGDSISTYLGSPNLQKETNIFIRNFGLGWSFLIITNLLITGLLIYITFLYFFKYKTPTYKPEVNTYKGYLGYIYYNDPAKFKLIYSKMPLNWKPFINQIGYSLFLSFMVYSFLLVFNNLAIAYFPQNYLNFTKLTGFKAQYLPIIELILLFYFYIRITFTEFIEFRKYGDLKN